MLSHCLSAHLSIYALVMHSNYIFSVKYQSNHWSSCKLIQTLSHLSLIWHTEVVAQIAYFECSVLPFCHCKMPKKLSNEDVLARILALSDNEESDNGFSDNETGKQNIDLLLECINLHE